MPTMAHVHLVLVRPRRPENIGAAARVAANMELAGLRLVAPPEWRTVSAFRMAWQAEHVLEDAKVFPDLLAAVGDCRLVAGLSGRGGDRIPHRTPRQLATEIAAVPHGTPVAVVFGNESSGLSRDERVLCQRQVRIPASTRQPSLNLAQAVMVVAYEIHLAGTAPLPQQPARATAGEAEPALRALRQAMLDIGFLAKENPETRFSEWRELFGRAGLTGREIRLILALARRIEGVHRRVSPDSS